jgi:phage FluMu gp28-like protein
VNSVPSAPSVLIPFRGYQREAFDNRVNGVEVWMWGRQTGKSFTLAAWAVDRLITRPGRLVTILSNSRANGAELNQKCAEIARIYQRAFEQADLSTDLRFECMNYETRITINGEVGRIKILAANPRTARGFSGDLILDEFAFHENSTAIWEAAEPILSANPDFLCRIASTPNGRSNMFYRMVNDPAIPKRIVPRSEAWRQGLVIAHPVTRDAITPDQARGLALDKRAYGQNYECIFESSAMVLLPNDLISQAEDPEVGVLCEDDWSDVAREILTLSTQRASRAQSERNENSCSADSVLSGTSVSLARNFYVGVDVGRSQDLTVITVLEKAGGLLLVRAMLRLRNLRLPAQQELLEVACRSPRFVGARIDMTGLGLGLYEYTRQRFGNRIHGLNFSSTIPLKPGGAIRASSAEAHNVRVPEALALHLLDAYESKRIRHPVDPLLREDLRKPERIVSPDGKVSIAAARSRNGSGHADHFWSLALAVHAALRPASAVVVIPGGRKRTRSPMRRRFVI